MSLKNVKEPEGPHRKSIVYGEGGGEEGNEQLGRDVVIRLKSFFVRRSNIYLEEVSGLLRCLQSNLCKMQKALKKTQRLTETKE